MWSKHLKVNICGPPSLFFVALLTLKLLVIARNALAQEESEEFSGDFSDPINIHIENDRDGCAC
jgi:hypothetical protein